MNIKLVFAYSETRKVTGELCFAFGLNDGLPWGHISQDMKNFKAATDNTTLLMGAKTFMSLPKALKGRPSIVVTKRNSELPKTKANETAEYYIFEDELIPFLEGKSTAGLSAWNSYEYKRDMKMHAGYEDISVIGGANILNIALPYANKIIKTSIIKKHYVNHSVSLDAEFIVKIQNDYKMVRCSWWEIDEITSMTESALVKKVL